MAFWSDVNLPLAGNNSSRWWQRCNNSPLHICQTGLINEQAEIDLIVPKVSQSMFVNLDGFHWHAHHVSITERLIIWSSGMATDNSGGVSAACKPHYTHTTLVALSMNETNTESWFLVNLTEGHLGRANEDVVWRGMWDNWVSYYSSWGVEKSNIYCRCLSLMVFWASAPCFT